MLAHSMSRRACRHLLQTPEMLMQVTLRSKGIEAKMQGIHGNGHIVSIAMVILYSRQLEP